MICSLSVPCPRPRAAPCSCPLMALPCRWVCTRGHEWAGMKTKWRILKCSYRITDNVRKGENNLAVSQQNPELNSIG